MAQYPCGAQSLRGGYPDSMSSRKGWRGSHLTLCQTPLRCSERAMQGRQNHRVQAIAVTEGNGLQFGRILDLKYSNIGCRIAPDQL